MKGILCTCRHVVAIGQGLQITSLLFALGLYGVGVLDFSGKYPVRTLFLEAD